MQDKCFHRLPLCSLLLGTWSSGSSTNICICMRGNSVYVAAVNSLFFSTNTHLLWSECFAKPTMLHIMIYEHDFFSRWMLDCCRILPAAALAKIQSAGAGTNPLLHCIWVSACVFCPYVPRSSRLTDNLQHCVSFYLVDGGVLMYRLFMRSRCFREQRYLNTCGLKAGKSYQAAKWNSIPFWNITAVLYCNSHESLSPFNQVQ